MRLLERRPVAAPGAGPYAVATTGDGVVWTSLVHRGALHRSGSADLVEFGPDSRPGPLAVAGDSVWVARGGDDALTRVDPDGSRHDVPLPAGTNPYGIAVTASGTWFSGLSGVLGHVGGNDRVTIVDLPGGSMPGMLAASPRGIWATCFGADAIVHWRPGSAPDLVPLADGPRGPVGICADAHGLRWAEITSGTLGVRDGRGTRHVGLPGPAPRPHAVVPDGSGGTWVTCWGSDSLVHVTPEGDCEELAFTTGDEPHGLCLDRDGNVLVALEAGFVAVVAVD